MSGLLTDDNHRKAVNELGIKQHLKVIFSYSKHRSSGSVNVCVEVDFDSIG